MFLFKKRQKQYLGIDIGASAVKLIELETKEGRYKLKNYGIFSLRKYLKREWYQLSLKSRQLTNEELVEIIKKSIKEAKIKSRQAYLSLPVYSSFSTLIDFPPLSEKELSAAIPFEAEKYVPLPISEVVLDWSVVSFSNQQKGVQVLLIAVPKEIVNDYKKVIQLAGLNFLGLESETFSLSRSLVGNDKSTIILIDLGARSVSVSIVDNGFVRTIGNLEMGSVKIIKAIAQQMPLDLEKAEKLKEKLLTSQLSEGQISQLKEIVHSILDVVISEIEKIIDSYQKKYNRKVEKCILVGGGIQIPDLVEYFTNKLNLEVSLGNPFARVICPSLLESTLKELGPSLAVAVGLAMRG